MRVVGRYDQLALPAFVLLAGCGLARVWRVAPRMALVVTLAYFTPLGVKLSAYYAVPSRDVAQSRQTAAALAGAVRDGDAVVLTGGRWYTAAEIREGTMHAVRRHHRLLRAVAAGALLAIAVTARAQSVVLYSNDFESPNVPVEINCGNSLDTRGINFLYGSPGFAFNQQFTVEAVVHADNGGSTRIRRGTGAPTRSGCSPPPRTTSWRSPSTCRGGPS